jgi:hypothetical protein
VWTTCERPGHTADVRRAHPCRRPAPCLDCLPRSGPCCAGWKQQLQLLAPTAATGSSWLACQHGCLWRQGWFTVCCCCAGADHSSKKPQSMRQSRTGVEMDMNELGWTRVELFCCDGHAVFATRNPLPTWPAGGLQLRITTELTVLLCSLRGAAVGCWACSTNS